MTATNILLDKYKESCSIASDNALAVNLGITRQSVFQWRRGLAWPSEDHVMAMAKAISEDASHWLPLIAADRAKNPEARKVWLRLAESAAAAIVLYAISRLDGHSGGAVLAFTPFASIHYAH